jgi:hypothetical protein
MLHTHLVSPIMPPLLLPVTADEHEDDVDGNFGENDLALS